MTFVGVGQSGLDMSQPSQDDRCHIWPERGLLPTPRNASGNAPMQARCAVERGSRNNPLSYKRMESVK